MGVIVGVEVVVGVEVAVGVMVGVNVTHPEPMQTDPATAAQPSQPSPVS